MGIVAKILLPSRSKIVLTLLDLEFLDQHGQLNMATLIVSSEHQQDEEEETNPCIVIVSGSGFIKAGFADDDAPRAVFSAIVGRPKHQTYHPSTHTGIMIGMDQKDAYVGDEAQSKRTTLTLNHPIKHGIITHWDDMEKIWHHTFFNALRIDPEEYSILLSVPVLNPKANNERMMNSMFTCFNTLSVALVDSAILPLYCYEKRTTGIVISSDFDVTHTVAVVAGYVIPSSVRRLLIGSDDLTNYMYHKLLPERGYAFSGSGCERPMVGDIKDKLCYVSLDYESEMAAAETIKEYVVQSDGNKIDVGNEMFRCPEVLFQPLHLGMDDLGIHEMVMATGMSCVDKIDQKKLFSSIVLSGKNCLFKGMAARLSKELNLLLSAEMEVVVVNASEVNEPPNYDITTRAYSTWIGGSIMSNSTAFQSRFVQRK